MRNRGGLEDAALQRALRAVGARRIDAVAGVGGTVIEADEASIAGVEQTLRRSGLFSSVEREQLVHIAEDPDDTYYQAQWGLPRGGVPAAWALSSGAGIIVGVVDTGVDASHPDLQGQLLPGYDFLNDDANPADDNGHGTRMSGIVGALCDNAEGVCRRRAGREGAAGKALDARATGPTAPSPTASSTRSITARGSST